MNEQSNQIMWNFESSIYSLVLFSISYFLSVRERSRNIKPINKCFVVSSTVLIVLVTGQKNVYVFNIIVVPGNNCGSVHPGCSLWLVLKKFLEQSLRIYGGPTGPVCPSKGYKDTRALNIEQHYNPALKGKRVQSQLPIVVLVLHWQRRLNGPKCPVLPPAANPPRTRGMSHIGYY